MLPVPSTSAPKSTIPSFETSNVPSIFACLYFFLVSFGSASSSSPPMTESLPSLTLPDFETSNVPVDVIPSLASIAPSLIFIVPLLVTGTLNLAAPLPRAQALLLFNLAFLKDAIRSSLVSVVPALTIFLLYLPNLIFILPFLAISTIPSPLIV